MILIEFMLYGLVGGLVGLKIFLLSFAAILFVYTLRERSRHRRMASGLTPDRRPRLDVHA
jgi:hypothetical protein